MANTQKYLNHLLQHTEITPACSEEERAAAELIAKIFRNHGFEPEVQEFSASGSYKLVQAGLGIAAFIGAVLMGIGGAVGFVGLALCVAAAVIFGLERSGRPVFSQLGSGGLSQNVIAYHRASGPLASPRNRPVVVVAHYDSPRADLLSQEPYAAYRPIIVKLLPFTMMAPAVIAVVRLLPLPDAAKVVMWVLAILCALIPLANAIAVIANKFVLPYTTGAVCNKSSVAAMLGVMDAVAPYELGEEFPKDVPFEEYFAEQQRILEEAIAAAEAAQAAQTEYPHEQAAASEVLEEDDADEPADQVEPQQAVQDLGGTTQMSVVEVADDQGGEQEVIEEEPPVSRTTTFEVVDPGSTVSIPVAPVAESPEVVEDAPVPEELPLEVEESPVEEEPDAPYAVNAEGNIRFGEDAIRALGMLPQKCAIVYEPERVEPEPELTAFEVEPEPEPEFMSVPQSIQEVADEPAYEDEDLEVEDDFEIQESFIEEEDYAEAAEDVAVEWQEPEVESAEDVVGADQSEVLYVEVFDEVDDDAQVLEAEIEYLEADQDVEAEEQAEEYIEEAQGLVEDDLQGECPDQETVEDDVEEQQAPAVDPDATVADGSLFANAPSGSAAPGSTVAMSIPPAFRPDQVQQAPVPERHRPVETVDSLMAEISRPATEHARSINVPSTTDAPVPRTPQTANRASLFDLPDPSAGHVDPFASPDAFAPQYQQAASQQVPSVPQVPDPASQARASFSVVEDVPQPQFDQIETISAPAPEAEKPRRGLGRLFGRKKKQQDSMSDWLGVDDDFDAKRTGGDIGSWDNFDDDWKGGAVSMNGATPDELREAIADMGDDELLGHDIWFVATGASECGNAGIKAFLNTHRDKLRGVFLINLECVGAGQVAMLSTEGERRVLKGDRRIMKLVQRVSADFHHEYGAMEMPYAATDAYAAMSMSLRSLTLAGVEGNGFALSHTEEDQPYNVDPENIAVVSDVVTEVIRRS